MPQHVHIEKLFEKALFPGCRTSRRVGWQGFVVLAALFSLSSVASAQQWQSYQLTNYGQNGAVAQCGSVADTLGNLHHYFICGFAPDFNYKPLLYMRTDFYGHILTDTVRVNGFAGLYSTPSFTSVLGDGSHSWCIFADNDPQNHLRGLYMTERDIQGNEVYPARLLGRPAGGSGPPSLDLAAALSVSDSTIHAVGNLINYGYYRFSTRAETLMWNRPIDGLVGGVGPNIALNPADGMPWAAFRNNWSPDVRLLVVRFGEDTSQTVYHPLAQTTIAWSPCYASFGIDPHGAFDFMPSCDTAASAYMRLDSTFQEIEDWLTIHRRATPTYETLKTDTTGNCLVFWDSDAYGLYWAYRRADGVWTHPLTLIDPNCYAYSMTIVAMDSERFAFTAEVALHPGDYLQLFLYTFGFPSYNSTSPSKPSLKAASIALTIHPNPFNSSARISFSVPSAGHMELCVYDIAGRLVITLANQRFEAGEHDVQFDGKGLASGTYVVRLAAKQDVSGRAEDMWWVQKMLLLK